MRAGAPVVHDKGEDAFIRNPERNVLIEVHGGVGDVEAGFAEADVIHEGTYSTHRGQHAHLETHCSIAWVDEDERLNVRTSSQSPFICRGQALLPVRPGPQDVRVFCERVGGGFGGKQEVLTEDLCALAAHEDRPAGAVGVHARGAVRRQHLPSPDADRRSSSGRSGTAR